MNLISGKILDGLDTERDIREIPTLIAHAYQGGALHASQVISACDALAGSLNETHIALMQSLGMTYERAAAELETVKTMLSRKYLETRIKEELCSMQPREFVPYGENRKVRQQAAPLGVLFHIAAGNVDALPAFSVIEGLLTGNVNILKLPGADNGLSIRVLHELMQYEPRIADYVMVFDTPSQDIAAMKAMADCADAIVVWGGDAAINAVRSMAAPDTRIIEWGHKISFAYVSGDDVSDAELSGIAYNMCETDGLFCSSCQGIYLDTDDFDTLCDFAQRFLRILQQQARSIPAAHDTFITAQKTLEIYTEKLEGGEGKRVLKGDGCSVIATRERTLTPSYMYRNCWVKPLPRNEIIPVLGRYKNHLQTAALICEDDERESLERLLCKTGIVRITSGRNMSQSYCAMPHDGERSLSRYVKIVSYEYD